MARPERFRREWLDLGMEKSSFDDKNLVLGIVRDVHFEIENRQLNPRKRKTRDLVQQRFSEAIPRTPAEIQNMEREDALHGLNELLRVYRVCLMSQRGTHLMPGHSGSLTTPFDSDTTGDGLTGANALPGGPIPAPSVPTQVQASPSTGMQYGQDTVEERLINALKTAEESEMVSESQFHPGYNSISSEYLPMGHPNYVPIAPRPSLSAWGVELNPPEPFTPAPKKKAVTWPGGYAPPGSGTISPPAGFKSSSGPLEGTPVVVSWESDLSKIVYEKAPSPDPQMPLIVQRPAERWGPASPFSSEMLRGLSRNEAEVMIFAWVKEQERRLDRFVSDTVGIYFHMRANPATHDTLMLLDMQTEQLDLVTEWKRWIARARTWFVVEWEKLNWTTDQLLENSNDGMFRLQIRETQVILRNELQKEQFQLIARSDWNENLFMSPPSRELWQLLCQWTERGFDYSCPLTIFNIPIGIVRASGWEAESGQTGSVHLGQALTCPTDPRQLSPNYMWLNSAYISLEVFRSYLHSEGLLQQGQSLWWSPEAVEDTDLTPGDGQTELTDQDTFLMAVSNTFMGQWWSFSGPRPAEGRHGPFRDGATPHVAIIIRDNERMEIDEGLIQEYLMDMTED